MKLLTALNLTLNEIQNAKIQNLSSAPTGYEGLIYYDTTLKQLGVYANSTQKYWLTTDLKAAASGLASLNSSSLVVQNPASAASTSGGNSGIIPVTPAGGRLDASFIPLLNNIPQPTSSLAMNSQAITGLADPTSAQDAATKNYVDAAVQGLDAKASVRVASIGANITKTGTQTIDTVVLSVNDRVLLKDQTLPQENGVYTVQSGAWTRATDCASQANLIDAYVFVEGGATNPDTGQVCTADPGGTLNTTALPQVQFSSAGTVTAANVGTGTGNVYRDKVGTVINFKTLKVGSTKITITNNADDVTIDVNPANITFASMTSSGTLPVLQGGTGSTTSTGIAASAVVLANTPTLITPVLGAATATSINKITITQPTTGAIITIADGATLATVGGYTTTITSTAATAVTLPTSGTLLSTAAAVTVAQGGTGGGTTALAKTNLGFMTRYAADIGNGSLTTIPVTHGLGTLDVTIQVYDKTGNIQVWPDISLTDTNTASLVFTVAPTSNQYRVVVIG